MPKKKEPIVISDLDEELKALIDNSEGVIGDFQVGESKTLPALAQRRTDTKAVDPDVEQDFIYVRDNLQSLIENGHTALDALVKLALNSDRPGAFEVVATLMNTVVTSNKELLELHTKKMKMAQQLDNEAASIGSQTNIQNNFHFNGTTEEVLDMIENAKREP